MKKYLMEFLIPVIAIGLLFGVGGTVMAQSGDSEKAEDEFTLEEITVTAEKREMDVQKVSTSMAVITADDLDVRSVHSVQEILSNTAGVSFYGFHNHIYVRGMGGVGNELGSEPSVQFNVDGNVYFNLEGRTTNPMLQATNDVERVEVIRGPSGTVNGRMASAGTINVISKSPDFEKVDGSVGITIGNYNTIRTSAAMNVPLKLTGLELPSFLERMSFRVALSEDKHEGYIHNEKGEPTGGMQNYFTVRSRMKWEPIEDLTINASYTYTRDASNMGMMVPPIDHDVQGVGPMRTSKAHPDDPWLNVGGNKMGKQTGNRQYNEGLEINWKTGVGTFNLRYGFSWIPQECNEADEGITCWSGKMGQKDYELRINSPEESKITWMAGVYYFRKKEYTGPDQRLGVIDPDTRVSFQEFYGNDDKWSDRDMFDPGTYGGSDDLAGGSAGWSVNDTSAPWRDTFTPYLDPLVPGEVAIFKTTNATRPIDAYSAYGNITIPLFEDRHRLVIGLRKNIEKKKRATAVGVFGPDDSYGGYPHFTYYANTIGDTTRGTWYCDNCYMLDAEEPQQIETKDNPLNYTLGWEYDLHSDVMFYLMVKNGFKPGGISPLATPNVEYKPETSTNFSLGMKSRWFDNTLQFNAEAFLMKIENFQSNVATQGALTRTINGVDYTQPFIFNAQTRNFGPMNNYGLDIDYDWLISSRDRLKGNMEFKKAEYGDLRVYLGKSAFPPNQPEWTDYKGRPMPFAPKFTFTGSYTHMFPIGNYVLTPQIDLKYSTKYFLFYEYWWNSVNPEMWQDPYLKWDTYVNFSPSAGVWTVNAYLKNVTETVIRNSAFFMGMNIEEPRTYGASLKIKF